MGKNPLKQHQWTMLGAAALAVALEVVPIFRFLSLPLQYLNAHLHEMSHAIMGILTGADVGPIKVYGDGSGVTLLVGGGTILTGSAGYLGASAIGTVAVYTARTEIGARRTLIGLGVALALSMAIWVRGDSVGIVAGLLWTVILFGASRLLKGPTLVFFAQFLGIVQCASSIQSLYIVLEISAFTGGHSDAKYLQDATGIPALAWSLSWCAISLTAMGLAARAAWRKPLKP